MPHAPRAALALAAACSLVLAGTAGAQPAPVPVEVVKQSAPPKKGSDLPNVKDVTEGMDKLDGLLTLYRYPADDVEHDPSRLLAVVPKSLLGQDLLLATSISRGPMAGFQWSDYLVRFERLGRNVVVSVPDLRYADGGVIGAAVSRTYTPGTLAALPVLATTDKGEPVVDLGAFVTGGSVQIPGVTSGGFFGSSSPRRDLSKYAKVKSFEQNVLIDVDLALADRSGQGSSVGVAYAFRRLPNLKQDDYQTRPADERVGYFTTARQDFNAKYDVRDITERFVNRWNLQKLDPTLDVSPPKEPIVFYVEKTVPVQWRRYVAEGVLEWNRAFEPLGITGAVVVRQQTDSDYADLDPEDARYNFIRWVVTGRGFAMGPSRVDPRTGQILDADIIFDDAMLRYQVGDFDLFSPLPPAGATSGVADLQFLRDHPAFLPMGVSPESLDAAGRRPGSAAGGGTYVGSNFGPSGDAGVAGGVAGRELLTDALAGRPASAARASADPAGCTYADGLRHELALNALAIKAAAVKTATGKEIPERLLGEVIREIVAHEVGHTLGLRHNFKGSDWLPMAEVRRRRDTTDEPTVASVMDYNPILFFPGDDLAKIRHYMTPAVGPYDEWAIEYGYSLPPKDGKAGEMLAKVAARNNEPGLAYATDEDTAGAVSPDPGANRYDMGDDPAAWADLRRALVDDLMVDLPDWAVGKDEPRSDLRDVFLTLFYEKARNLSYVARVVGGQRFNRTRAGDPGATDALRPVGPDEQRAAMAMLGQTIFADGYFDLDPRLLNNLAASREDDWTTNAPYRIDFPVHAYVLRVQSAVLDHLTDPAVLQRVYDAELKYAPATAEPLNEVSPGDDTLAEAGDATTRPATRPATRPTTAAASADNAVAADAVEPDKFTAAELVAGTTALVWADLAPDPSAVAADTGGGPSTRPATRPYTDAAPMISSTRRNLQARHVESLVALVDSPPGRLVSPDLQNLVRYQLRELAATIGEALDAADPGGDQGGAPIDLASRAHLTETKSRIDRVLDAPHQVGGGSGGTVILMIGQDGVARPAGQ